MEETGRAPVPWWANKSFFLLFVCFFVFVKFVFHCLFLFWSYFIWFGCSFFFFLIFWLCCAVRWVLVPSQGSGLSLQCKRTKSKVLDHQIILASGNINWHEFSQRSSSQHQDSVALQLLLRSPVLDASHTSNQQDSNTAPPISRQAAWNWAKLIDTPKHTTWHGPAHLRKTLSSSHQVKATVLPTGILHKPPEPTSPTRD